MNITDVNYLRWHKGRTPVRFDLAISGVPNVPLAPLLADPEEFDAEIARCGGYGHPELTATIAARYGLTDDRVLTVQGTSMANFVALACVANRGERIVLETPVYEPIRRVADLLELQVISLPRGLDAGGGPSPIDFELVETALRGGAVAVVLTNLHNPTGVRLPDGDLNALIAICEKHGARALVDEVYLDAGHVVFGEPIWSAASRSEAVVVTNSLTKVYGLSALRAGWVAAPPTVIARAQALVNQLHSLDAKPALVMALRVLRRIGHYAETARRAYRAARPVFDAWLRNRPDVHANRDDGAFFAWVTIDGVPDTHPLVERLLADFETRVTPGHFFEAPHGLRLGFLPSESEFSEALGRVGRAIDQVRG